MHEMNGKVLFGVVMGCIAVFSSANGQEASKSTMPKGAIYDKPFVKGVGKGVFLGGYIDLAFANTNGTGSDVTFFDQQRFVPFIYGEIHPRIHIASEIEFEHGGFVSGDPTETTDGEIKIEFATVDITFYDGLNFRGGVVLSPLGKFNLVHDSPINELTERPRVDRLIIPTTLSEAGVGFFGTLYPTEMSALSYEIYAVNGFNGDLTASGTTDIRDARGGVGQDNNRGKSMVSRLAYSPFLGAEIGGSVHTGPYSNNGDDWLTIAAADWTLTRGPFEFLGEYAHAWLENGINEHGWYGQFNYRFLHGLMSLFPESYFTGIFRYDWVDQSAGEEGDDEDRYTIGLNFRPIAQTAVKVDYAFLGSTAAGSSNRLDDGGQLSFSVASYF